MSAKIFSACMCLGHTLVTVGVGMRFGVASGLIVCGLGMVVLTLITLKVAGRAG